MIDHLHLRFVVRTLPVLVALAWACWPAAALAEPDPFVEAIDTPQLVSPGQAFEVRVRAVNRGDTSRIGSISISFPDRPAVAVVGSSSTSAAGSYAKVLMPGENVYNLQTGGRVPAQFPLAEWYAESPWGRGETRFLTVRVTPSGGTGALRMYVRATARGAGGLVTSNGTATDQQGFPALVASVAIQAPVPPTQPLPPTQPPAPTQAPVVVVVTATPVPATQTPVVVVVTATSQPTSPPTVAVQPTATSAVFVPPGAAANTLAPAAPAGTDRVQLSNEQSGGSSALLALILAGAIGVVVLVVVLTRRRQLAFASPPVTSPSWPPYQTPAHPSGGSVMPPTPAGYELVGSPMKGGMAVVYKARQASLNRFVALKFLDTELSADPTFVSRFLSEAERTANLDHPNIVTVHDRGQAPDGRLFIVMRFVDGMTLEELCRRDGRLPLPRIQSLIAQVAMALDFAHGRGVVHRDVKPSNVLVEAGDRVTLTDFGIAIGLGGSRVTRTRRIVGTPAYMAPEQALGKPVDHRTDLYALGVVLYELVTGDVPFVGDTEIAVANAHVILPVPHPSERDPSISPVLAAVVLRALAKDPADRFQSGSDLVQALQAAASASSVGSYRCRPIR